MKRTAVFPVAVALLSALAATRTHAQVEIAGVTVPATVDAGGQSLVLNGAALRKKAVFKVYVAGLYLPAKSNDADAILAADGPRELRMEFVRDVGKDKMCEAWDESLKNNTPDADAILAADAPRELRMQFVRDVGKDKMCEAWDESLKNNTPGADAQLQGEFKELCGWMQDLKKGDVMSFTYLPASGTTVAIAGQTKGSIAGKPFADALFKSWIGPKPGPGNGFKHDLLGVKE